MGVSEGSELEPLGTSELDRRPRNFPCKDGPGCKFLSLPVGCRYQHDDLPSASGGSAVECYRCNGFGHFARDCPTSAGIRRGALPRGGGPIRGTVAHHSREQQHTTTLECYLCNRVGHFARDCVRGRGGPEERSLRCLKCHRRGHFAKDCREEESRCFRCYNSGHLAKDCEEPDLCYHCNKRGHTSRDCPDGDLKTCSNVVARAILPSTAQVLLIRRKGRRRAPIVRFWSLKIFELQQMGSIKLKTFYLSPIWLQEFDHLLLISRK